MKVLKTILIISFFLGFAFAMFWAITHDETNAEQAEKWAEKEETRKRESDFNRRVYEHALGDTRGANGAL